MSTPTPQSPFGQPTQPTWGQVPPVTPPATKPSRRKAWFTHGAVAVVALGLGAGIGGGGGSGPVAESRRPAPAVTVTKTAEAAEAAAPKPAVTVTAKAPAKPKPTKKPGPPSTVDGDGQYLVGEDIKAGTYKTAGPQDDDFGLGCYWARLKNASGEFDAIIANDNITGQARVTVHKGEYFETKGCNKWEKVG
ncbi:hypothetical protein ACFZAU_40125 [Streptomyces sp. NPDC008238]